MTTFNSFKFQKIDSTSTTTIELSVDGCQEVVDEFISFMRGCGYMDANIYAAMANAEEEYRGYIKSDLYISGNR
jgi:acetolactate synthase small subunit